MADAAMPVHADRYRRAEELVAVVSNLGFLDG